MGKSLYRILPVVRSKSSNCCFLEDPVGKIGGPLNGLVEDFTKLYLIYSSSGSTCLANLTRLTMRAWDL